MVIFLSAGSRKEKFDHVEEWITDAIENLDNALSELKTTTQSEGLLHVFDCVIEQLRWQDFVSSNSVLNHNRDYKIGRLQG